MFSIDCMQNRGVALSICKHNYFVGTCCKLPDHNNFVGIVYDLRETETPSGQLEARVQQLNRLATATAINKQQLADSLEAAAAAVAAAAATNSAAPLSSDTTTTATTAQSAGAATNTSGAGDQTTRQLDERYMISSTSLFAPSTVAAQTVSTVAPPVAGNRLAVASGAPAAETGRDADGSAAASAQLVETSAAAVAQQAPPAAQVVALSEQLQQSNQQQEPPQAAQIETLSLVQAAQQQHSNAYELLRPEESSANLGAAQQQNSLDVVSTISSAHSAPTLFPANNSSSPAGDLAAEKQVVSIVFANNHQQQQLTALSPGAGSQEFALNSVAAPSADSSTCQTLASTSIATAATTAQQQTTSLSTAPTTVDSQAPTLEPKQATLQSSPTAAASSIETQTSTATPTEFDLVSSQQVTTPFTSSLSTALLPNISSHPFSPTPAASLVSSPTSSSSAATSNLSPVRFQQAEEQAKPLSPQTGQQNATRHVAQNTTTTTLSSLKQPSLILLGGAPTLQSKIVSGSSTGNNLIPGLNGLHSAILSQIPFRIASGLSSGLTSYLQAAMKPTGSRPLLSSNTAPALQYQQQHSNSTVANKAAAGGIRFPALSGASSTMAALAATASEAPPPRDLVKEANLVCGKPQIEQPSNSATGHKKRVARIVGGNQSLFGQWPWMVSLRQWRKGAFLHKCGAALLTENWAITAAHCVEK